MLKFYSGRWSKEQLDAMQEATNECCFSVMQLAGCVNHDSNLKCRDCYFRKPCNDFMRLKLHVDELVENSVEKLKT